MTRVLKGSEGVSLVELMVALVISAILIAALFRTFIAQQKAYNIQEQVVDMQQNARLAISKTIRDIRMVGFGNVGRAVLSAMGRTSPITMNGDNITVLGAYQQLKDDDTKEPITVTEAAGKMIILSHPTDKFDDYDFICIGGLFSYVLQGPKPRGEVSVLTLDREPTYDLKGEYVYKIEALTYSLDAIRDRDLVERDTIESVQFGYFDENGNPTGTADNVRMVKLTVTAKTKEKDPDYNGVDGYRRRVFTSNIQLRNIGIGFP
jgi:prepilin-type N-terminal cleavage/methylation domain-containing protein